VVVTYLLVHLLTLDHSIAFWIVLRSAWLQDKHAVLDMELFAVLKPWQNHHLPNSHMCSRHCIEKEYVRPSKSSPLHPLISFTKDELKKALRLNCDR
jgi:hypothetical protein